jgi:hypothetical protein
MASPHLLFFLFLPLRIDQKNRAQAEPWNDMSGQQSPPLSNARRVWSGEQTPNIVQQSSADGKRPIVKQPLQITPPLRADRS